MKGLLKGFSLMGHVPIRMLNSPEREAGERQLDHDKKYLAPGDQT